MVRTMSTDTTAAGTDLGADEAAAEGDGTAGGDVDVDPDGDAAGGGGSDTPDNVLFDVYERYVGDPDAETDVYVGFALFFGGLALGAAGILVFLLSGTVEGMTVYAYREVASVATAASLPVIMLGVVVLLPGNRRVTAAAVVGSLVCAGAIGLFVWSYPQAWNVSGTDYSLQGVAIYAVGLVAVMGATASTLVGHQVERARESAGGSVDPEAVAAAARAELEDDEEELDVNRETEDEAAVRERAESDYEAALEGADVSWGGVAKTETRRLELDTSAVDDVDGSNVDTASANEARGAGVDDAVSGLRGLKGEGTKTDSGGGTDEQASALRELREQQRTDEGDDEDAEPPTPGTPRADDDADSGGVIGRVRSLLPF